MKKLFIILFYLFFVNVINAQYGDLGLKFGGVYFVKEKIKGVQGSILYARPIKNRFGIKIEAGVYYSNTKGIFRDDYKGEYSLFDQNFKAPSTSPYIDKEKYIKDSYGFLILNQKPDSYYILKFSLGSYYEIFKSEKYEHSISLSGTFSYHDYVKYVEAVELKLYSMSDDKFLQYIPLYRGYDDIGLELGYDFKYNLNERLKISFYLSGNFYTSKVVTLSSGVGFYVEMK